jgi:hypothetical protein
MHLAISLLSRHIASSSAPYDAHASPADSVPASVHTLILQVKQLAAAQAHVQALSAKMAAAAGAAKAREAQLAQQVAGLQQQLQQEQASKAVVAGTRGKLQKRLAEWVACWLGTAVLWVFCACHSALRWQSLLRGRPVAVACRAAAAMP